MFNKLCFILFFSVSSIYVKAQSMQDMDSLQLKNINDSCGSIIFTRTEIMPDFKNGKQAFEDSLSNYLGEKNKKIRSGTIEFELVICKNGDVVACNRLRGGTAYEEVLFGWLINSKNLFMPATQNKYVVCCWQNLTLNFSGDKINAFIIH